MLKVESLKVQKLFRYSKKGDRAKLEIYRPISEFISLSKVFLKLLYQRKINFCERNQLFTSAKFGYRSKNHVLIQ